MAHELAQKGKHPVKSAKKAKLKTPMKSARKAVRK